jgi:uncharacterized protein YecA (UPF0149 family)
LVSTINTEAINIKPEEAKPKQTLVVSHTEPSEVSGQKEKEVGRNGPCPCGSGKKYKKCHGA